MPPNSMISGDKKEQVVRHSQTQLALKYSSYCFHSHPYRLITKYVFLNLTLQCMEKVPVLLWKNSAARNRTLVRFGLSSWQLSNTRALP